ncbi:MAG: hypothetical protein ACREK8_02280 [Gemmatimonadales bacterium]
MIEPEPRASRLSTQNPWPGLRAFTENDREFFLGREAETAELLSLVQRKPVVVLYGQSGLGKTSLLQAGLLPELAALDFLPIRLRLDHDDGEPPLADQVKAALAQGFTRARVSAPVPEPGETLWEYFHRKDIDVWGPGNRLLTPVIVLDQFEEIFTLGRRSAEATARGVQFADEMEALLEHRPPDAVRERLEAHPDEASRFDLQRQAIKFVISLREDFLPELDPWRARMPSLMQTRFRLERMTGAQALEVVGRAGRDLVDPPVAHDIVDFVSMSQRKTAARAVEQRDVEPALLSVVCDELNRRRIARDQAKITASLLTDERQEIIQSFYERSFDGIDPRVRNWVEDELLTASGYRDRAALEDAIRQGLDPHDFDILVDRRMLHREERSGVVWLELTHDLLSDPASQSRAAREQRREAEAAAEREADLRQKAARARARNRTVLAVALVFLVVGILGWHEAGVAGKAQHKADSLATQYRRAAQQATAMAAVADRRLAQHVIDDSANKALEATNSERQREVLLAEEFSDEFKRLVPQIRDQERQQDSARMEVERTFQRDRLQEQQAADAALSRIAVVDSILCTPTPADSAAARLIVDSINKRAPARWMCLTRTGH